MYRPMHFRRCAFTIIEMVVVVMILGILAAIAAQRLFRTSDAAIDNGVRQSLGVIRTAIDSFAAQHDGNLPGADSNEVTFKSDIAPYLRGAEFPSCPVGEAKNNQVRMMNSGSIVSGIAGSAASKSWVYNYGTGDFFINSADTSTDKATIYYYEF